jgi:hypothetical protein
MNEVYYRVDAGNKKNTVFFVSLLRSFHDNLVFERIEKKETQIFEFFLTNSGEKELLNIMNFFKKKNIIISYEKRDMKDSSLYLYKD